MIVVADTSPLTALLHLGKLSLLPQLYGKVFLPQAVADELQTLLAFGYDISFLAETETFVVRTASDVGRVRQLSEDLDAGEAEAIVLAAELRADLLLIDEQLGKEVAQAAGIACKGLVPQVKPLLDDLMQNLKFRLSEKIYRLALEKAGEV